MTDAIPHVITISRQLGSGGAYLGQRLAFRLMRCIWTMKSCVSCGRTQYPRRNLAVRDEKVTSRWQAILQSFCRYDFLVVWTSPIGYPHDKNLYKVNRILLHDCKSAQWRLSSGAAGHSSEAAPRMFKRILTC